MKGLAGLASPDPEAGIAHENTISCRLLTGRQDVGVPGPQHALVAFRPASAARTRSRFTKCRSVIEGRRGGTTKGPFRRCDPVGLVRILSSKIIFGSFHSEQAGPVAVQKRSVVTPSHKRSSSLSVRRVGKQSGWQNGLSFCAFSVCNDARGDDENRST